MTVRVNAIKQTY